METASSIKPELDARPIGMATNQKSESPLATLAKIPPPPDLSAVPYPSKETIAAIAREVNFSVPKDVRAKAAELQAAFEKAQANQIAHTGDAARAAFWAQQQNLTNAVSASTDISNRDAWAEEDFREDFREKFLAFRAETFRISQQAHALALPLAEGFAAKANALADKLEMPEIEIAARFHVRHVPCDAVLSIRKLADHVLRQGREYFPKSGTPPKTIFAHLPE